jgi:hypothetical protein
MGIRAIEWIDGEQSCAALEQNGGGMSTAAADLATMLWLKGARTQ